MSAPSLGLRGAGPRPCACRMIGINIRHSNKRQGRKLKLDESYISNPKSEMSNRIAGNHGLGTAGSLRVQFAISDFGFEMQDSSNFKIPPPWLSIRVSLFISSDSCTLPQQTSPTSNPAPIHTTGHSHGWAGLL